MADKTNDIHDFKPVNLKLNPLEGSFQDTASTCNWRVPQSEVSMESECAVSFHPDMKIGFPKKETKSKERKKLARHGPEYDFTIEEILPSVLGLRGWHPQISEKEIPKILTKLLGTDGHFVLFYWDRKKRPAFSVTFRGLIKTYIIHKKPALRTGSDTLFFVDHNGPYDRNLKNLINYHLQNGIVDRSSDDVISLSYPVSF